MRHPLISAILAGGGAFAAATCVMILVAGQLSDWHAPSPLEPLRPGVATETTPSTSEPTTSTDLTFAVDGGTARGVLTAPHDVSEAGVVLVAGAGASDRRSLLPLAEQLAAAGVAVLTYDKRTAGYSPLQRDYAQLAGDALAAVDALRRTTGITRIGALGLSEGGWVLTAAAARADSALDFVVLGSASVVSPLEQISWTADTAVVQAPRPLRSALATVLAGGRAVMGYLDFDSRPLLAATRVPVLALWGADDETVPVNEAYRRLRMALGDRLSAQIIADTGHELGAGTDPWLASAAQWMLSPSGPFLIGVEPVESMGVAVAPGPSWLTDPRIHVAVSLVMSIVTALAVWRRSAARLKRAHQ